MYCSVPVENSRTTPSDPPTATHDSDAAMHRADG